jgi:hypothetical protein
MLNGLLYITDATKNTLFNRPLTGLKGCTAQQIECGSDLTMHACTEFIWIQVHNADISCLGFHHALP